MSSNVKRKIEFWIALRKRRVCPSAVAREDGSHSSILSPTGKTGEKDDGHARYFRVTSLSTSSE
jgi:hypothetical protein